MPEFLQSGKKQPVLIMITNMIRYEVICQCRLLPLITQAVPRRQPRTQLQLGLELSKLNYPELQKGLDE